MNQKLAYLTFGALCVYGLSFSQIKTVKNDSTTAAPHKIDLVQIDSISDGKNLAIKEIEPVTDSLSSKTIEDLQLASEFDQKWLEELYSNELFDSIYASVTDLKYDAVDYPELPTDTLKARLHKLSAKTPFNIEYNESLESVIKSYLKHRRNSLERLMSLSDYYFPMFERELDNYNIPLEVKYLAIVESALKPRAKSRVGATGLWQFMFATGKQYNLNVSSYVDERSDPLKSTEAASKYLARLYEIFGDWDLALASYNCGPGNVSKAIRRSGGYENYWNIRPYLPRETAGYLPAFLATMYIFEYAEEHGFKKHRPDFRYIDTDTIHVKQTISLDQVSELLELPMEELQFLNPSYKLDIIPFVEGKNYTLRLPRHAVGRFVTNEASIYEFVNNEMNKREKPLPQLFNSETKTTYRVVSGDNLGKIARQFGVRVSQLKQWNGLRSNNIRIGQRLTIYRTQPTTSASKSVASKSNNQNAASGGSQTYKVRSGDSLWSISRKFPGVSIQNIKDWNDISGSNLKVGTTLKLSR
ncbi:lytic transglycosylase domain-containing protein [Gelidibacter maritimus]|uniref:LysM peptidoglycan-binding domain-containing protein n=1 Tax=Gelidibacter maritimus TaxID=2761487 RepID=A0A7W2R2N0_9FLAO|nr:lytic transglycosylase domain-containing protein [Gelidibacter maritimus]MBA6151949.1 LysM peptidoglycan-binding domain-containing protein [Gelidibacter maritimus]